MNKNSYVDDAVHFMVSVGSKQIISKRMKSNIVSLFKVLAGFTVAILFILLLFTQYSIYKEKKYLEYSIKKVKTEFEYLKSKRSTFEAYKTQINNYLGYKSD